MPEIHSCQETLPLARKAIILRNFALTRHSSRVSMLLRLSLGSQKLKLLFLVVWRYQGGGSAGLLDRLIRSAPSTSSLDRPLRSGVYSKLRFDEKEGQK